MWAHETMPALCSSQLIALRYMHTNTFLNLLTLRKERSRKETKERESNLERK